MKVYYTIRSVSRDKSGITVHVHAGMMEGEDLEDVFVLVFASGKEAALGLRVALAAAVSRAFGVVLLATDCTPTGSW